jgi:hypothetical protein
MDPSYSSKDRIWFLRVRHHISNEIYCSNVPERKRGYVCLLRPGRIWLKKGVCVEREREGESNKATGSFTPGPRFDYITQ